MAMRAEAEVLRMTVAARGIVGGSEFFFFFFFLFGGEGVGRRLRHMTTKTEGRDVLQRIRGFEGGRLTTDNESCMIDKGCDA